MQREGLKFVVVGHVDHGKSTLIGRLLYDTNSLPPDKMEEVKRASEADGSTTEFAFVMDHLEEERKNRVTIDTAQIWFRTPNREYVIIDAPGHKQFLKNMITGSSLAEAALLLIDAEEGLREQTHRHAYLLSLLGVKQVIVVINKMDLVDFSQARFDELQNDITARLKEFGIEPLCVVPISAQLGDNMAATSENLAWYQGKTLLDTLDTLQHIGKPQDAPLRFPLQDIYDLDGEKVLVGKLVSGTLNKGQEVIFHPCGKSAKIKEIKQFGKTPTSVGPGESIGITIEDGIAIKALKRGQIACSVEPSPNISNRITATVFWMSGEPLEVGEEMELKCATQQLTCKIKKIQNRMNSSNLEVIEKTATELADTEVAKLTVTTEDYLCTDPFEQIEETGRFVLMRDADTVAGGVLH
jgi:sulfate adenylyltransferase large subunit